jgi:hypothetical protein
MSSSGSMAPTHFSLPTLPALHFVSYHLLPLHHTSLVISWLLQPYLLILHPRLLFLCCIPNSFPLPLAFQAPYPFTHPSLPTPSLPLSFPTHPPTHKQGPYVYHLYEHYGFSVRDIGRLFIMGFGGSAVFGTIVGAMADRV